MECITKVYFLENISLPSFSDPLGQDVKISQVGYDGSKVDKIRNSVSDSKHHRGFLLLLGTLLVLPPFVHVASADREHDKAIDGVNEEAGGKEVQGGVWGVAVKITGNAKPGHRHARHAHLGEESGLDITKLGSLHVGEHSWAADQSHPELSPHHGADRAEVDEGGVGSGEAGDEGGNSPRGSGGHQGVVEVRSSANPVNSILESMNNHSGLKFSSDCNNQHSVVQQR